MEEEAKKPEPPKSAPAAAPKKAEPPAPTPAKSEDVVFEVTDKTLQKVLCGLEQCTGCCSASTC